MIPGKLHAWLASAAMLGMSALLDAAAIQPRAAVVPTLSGGLNQMGPVGSSTYPRANFLSDGSLIGAYTAREDDGAEMIITIAHSTDAGVTWTEIGTVDRGPSATTDKDNPYPFQLPSGRVLVAFRNHDRTAPTTWTYYRITICYSDDNGATWQYLSTPAEESNSATGVWEPFFRLAADGETLQLYYSRENNASDQDSLMRTSTDGGLTWSDPTVLSGAELPTSRDGMLGVAEVSGPGDLIAVFETEMAGSSFHIASVRSPDDGATWGNRKDVYIPATGSAAAPQVINVGGTLVVSFQSTEGGNDNTMYIVTSGDGGETWDNKIVVMEPTSLWAGLLTLDDTSFLGMADHDGAKTQKVLLS
ncbi:hypothetical protein SLS56_011093 [Neofusicoccum ribis]|uniref:Sialidase domain-containing protein n=1 Tax=Neofusicoccum ribis TaxID=45134 RepID=A0ABR3SCQ1_9PEZI